MNHPRTSLALAITLTAVLALGCAEKGNTGGRIDPYRSTGSDEGSRRAHIPSLLESTDQTGAALMQELRELDLTRHEGKAVLELGDIANKTRTPTTDFELMQQRLRGQLFQSKMLREKFVIVEGRQRMDRELDRVADAEGVTARYDPAATYVLQGDFLEANRGDRRQYYWEFKLTNLATRQIVFLKNFDLGQYRD